MIAIARFRTPFSVIEELAALLAPVVAEVGVVPMIVPIAEGSLAELTWKTPIIRAMTDQGVLLFDREYDGE
jgi:hypothetical protein